MLLSALKSTIFRITNQQTKFCALFFSKINPDAHFGTKINTFTILKGGLGAIAPRSQKMVKQMEAFPFLHKILHIRRVDSPVMM